MGHGFENGDTMFSVKERPWHGLGTIVNEAPSTEEAIKLAGLDWEVGREPAYVNIKDTNILIPNKKSIVRYEKDQAGEIIGGIPFGTVGDAYHPLQNKDAFSFFDPFVENELATLETAGSLFSGKKVFILARINGDNLAVGKDDEIEKFILLSNTHDGTTAVRIGYTPVRVVCNNTLQMAHKSDASQLIRVRHTKQIKANIEDLRGTMDLVNQQFITTVEKYKYLQTRDINQRDLENYVKAVFSGKSLEQVITDREKEEEDVEKARTKLMARVEEIFDVEPARGTAWGMYNSVQGYIQHERGGVENTEGRYNQLWFDEGARLNRRALEIALQY